MPHAHGQLSRECVRGGAMHSDAARAFIRFVCGQHGSMQVVHNVSIHERRWPDADGAQAHCDCGWGRTPTEPGERESGGTSRCVGPHRAHPASGQRRPPRPGLTCPDFKWKVQEAATLASCRPATHRCQRSAWQPRSAPAYEPQFPPDRPDNPSRRNGIHARHSGRAVISPRCVRAGLSPRRCATGAHWAAPGRGGPRGAVDVG